MEDLRTLLAANRRLFEEVTQLRERLTAYERSRWWRLHPRFAWRRLVRRGTEVSEDDRGLGGPQVERGACESVASSSMLRFQTEVVERGSFTQDWFTHEIPGLEPLVASLVGARARVLEIGSFEGLSTCWFLWQLRDAQVTAIDTFAGSVEHAGFGSDVSELENAFDRNVAVVDASRVRKLVGDSRRLLLGLLEERARFDVVYVDGSHLALDVLVDASLSWQLLDDGGIMFFDDYTWTGLGEDRLLGPVPQSTRS